MGQSDDDENPLPPAETQDHWGGERRGGVEMPTETKGEGRGRRSSDQGQSGNLHGSWFARVEGPELRHMPENDMRTQRMTLEGHRVLSEE